MKKEDLMIGDLVYYSYANHFVTKVIDVCTHDEEPFIRCKRDEKDNLYKQDQLEDFHVGILRPIPLTPEILEKNGFEKIKDDDGEELYLIVEHKIGYLPHDLCLHKRDALWANAILNIYEVKEKLIGSPYKVFTNYEKEWAFLTNYCECGFVHELQHVLKVRGIKKEIVL